MYSVVFPFATEFPRRAIKSATAVQLGNTAASKELEGTELTRPARCEQDGINEAFELRSGSVNRRNTYWQTPCDTTEERVRTCRLPTDVSISFSLAHPESYCVQPKVKLTMLVRYARHNVRSLRKEEKPGRRFIVIDSVNSFPLPADGSEAILGVPMWVGGERGLHLDVDLLTLRARLGQPA